MPPVHRAALACGPPVRSNSTTRRISNGATWASESCPSQTECRVRWGPHFFFRRPTRQGERRAWIKDQHVAWVLRRTNKARKNGDGSDRAQNTSKRSDRPQCEDSRKSRVQGDKVMNRDPCLPADENHSPWRNTEKQTPK